MFARSIKVGQDNFFRGSFSAPPKCTLQAVPNNTRVNPNNNGRERLNVNFSFMLWCFISHFCFVKQWNFEIPKFYWTLKNRQNRFRFRSRAVRFIRVNDRISSRSERFPGIPRHFRFWITNSMKSLRLEVPSRAVRFVFRVVITSFLSCEDRKKIGDGNQKVEKHTPAWNGRAAALGSRWNAVAKTNASVGTWRNKKRKFCPRSTRLATFLLTPSRTMAFQALLLRRRYIIGVTCHYYHVVVFACVLFFFFSTTVVTRRRCKQRFAESRTKTVRKYVR